MVNKQCVYLDIVEASGQWTHLNVLVLLRSVVPCSDGSDGNVAVEQRTVLEEERQRVVSAHRRAQEHCRPHAQRLHEALEEVHPVLVTFQCIRVGRIPKSSKTESL